MSESGGVSPPISAPKLVPAVVSRARAAAPFIVEFESNVIALAVNVCVVGVVLKVTAPL